MARLIVIHGCGNKGEKPDFETEKRAKRGAEAAKHHHTEVIHFYATGGLFSKEQEGIAVSTVIAEILKKQELHNTVVTEESESRTTIENVMNLKDKYSADFSTAENILVVTSDYHAIRTWLIWRLLTPFKNITVVGISSHITAKKVGVEIVGIAVLLAYKIGWHWPENFFRKNSRTIKAT